MLPNFEPRPNDFELERFLVPRSALRAMDLIASDTASIMTFTFTPESERSLSVDITTVVNETLFVGHGYLAFRLRDVTIETLGNRQNQAEGLYLDFVNCRLEIVP